MKKTIIISSIIISSLLSCDPGEGKLKFANNSNEIIYYYEGFCNDSIKYLPIKINDGKIDIPQSDILASKGETNSVMMGKWKDRINECKDSAIRIYFFKKELVENVPEDSFLRRQAYSKKFKLKVKDLEKMNWRVVYDGK